jgi:hypothetical protein
MQLVESIMAQSSVSIYTFFESETIVDLISQILGIDVRDRSVDFCAKETTISGSVSKAKEAVIFLQRETLLQNAVHRGQPSSRQRVIPDINPYSDAATGMAIPETNL